ncbi:hypothetical protein SprV_0100001400 [Sparganum proliferum]
MPGPSYIETTRQPNENLPPERQLLQEIKQELMSLRKKVDFLSEKAILSDSNFKDMKAMLADTRRALQTVSFVSKEKPPVIQLPLRTSEDYDEFVSKVGTDREIFEETVKHLSTVGGRTEKEFIRNLLTSLMGPPLCQSFCWSRPRLAPGARRGYRVDSPAVAPPVAPPKRGQAPSGPGG